MAGEDPAFSSANDLDLDPVFRLDEFPLELGERIILALDVLVNQVIALKIEVTKIQYGSTNKFPVDSNRKSGVTLQCVY